MGYSYLVLGTRSEAKFEKVPSTNYYSLQLATHAPQISHASLSQKNNIDAISMLNKHQPLPVESEGGLSNGQTF